jgi:hypothetical protein
MCCQWSFVKILAVVVGGWGRGIAVASHKQRNEEMKFRTKPQILIMNTDLSTSKAGRIHVLHELQEALLFVINQLEFQ